ncbi:MULTISPECIES: glycoside hydrolase family 3 N-terminal domain-containing protein [unclassified Actinomyces]|uniref:glycoside hydrolase family 3 N-terminal domain-containing protein n=1 Tax=unclassified Actinomyces TaxID=2609248 RepID=UPI000D59A4ED|nr:MULTISPECIES: glycoside hydrolase family 3 N-terminal domain-containing protein [unclassified Actinomyces]RAX21572.1 glycoside hydrolase family 3 protein [Actinomyces sp. Z3]
MRITCGRSLAAVAVAAALALTGCTSGGSTADATASSNLENNGNTYITQELDDGQTRFTRVVNPNGGQVLSYSADGGMTIIEQVEGEYTYAFKDFNGNGELDPAEDWRRTGSERAADYATGLSKEQMAGLMLFSAHERAPEDGLTAEQQQYLSESYLRAVLNAGGSDVTANVQWVNQMQAYVETLASADTPYIPVNFSSDPRSDASGDGAFTGVGEISSWPGSLGLAATFDPDTVLQFGQMASQEYRSLGIGTALSPQIDLATEPRWLRVSGTFGEDAEMAGAMAANYVAGFQGTYTQDGGEGDWGTDSVATMIKHWPGDGAGEGGRESHTNAGKYEVMVGGNSAEHRSVFQQALESSAVMTSYSITLNAEGEPEYTQRMGSSYDDGKLSELRDDNAYEGVVVTDWGVTRATTDPDDPVIATGWGAEDLSVEERHFQIIKNGTDMFGGNNDAAPVLAAYDLWQEAYEAGELDIDAQTRWQQSAARILTMSFNIGAFDDPFLDLAASQAQVGSQDKVTAGQEAQLNSVVTLKNDGAITLDPEADFSDKTVYIPQTYDTGFNSAFSEAEYTEGPSLDVEVAEQYFGKVVTDEVEYDADGHVTGYTAPDLTDVDLVLVGMRSPINGTSFSKAGWNEEEDSWYPLSLQYGTYTADGENVRRTSISGDILDDGGRENRSYYGATSAISNAADLDAFNRAADAVAASDRDIPVVVALKATNPVVPAEFEARADAIVVGFGVADEALIRIALGLHESNGRLPIQFPADMDTVEANQEDVPKDLTPYTDSAGNAYDYGFGLHLDGSVIED